MGALDFLKEFEGRVLDAASYQLLRRNYELQEENNRQLKEKADRLETEIAALQNRTKELSAQNQQLREKLSRLEEEAHFELHEGIAFKRDGDGQIQPTPYCPNCHVVMSTPGICVYKCQKCDYVVKAKVRADVLATQIKSKNDERERTA